MLSERSTRHRQILAMRSVARHRRYLLTVLRWFIARPKNTRHPISLHGTQTATCALGEHVKQLIRLVLRQAGKLRERRDGPRWHAQKELGRYGTDSPTPTNGRMRRDCSPV